MSKFLQLLLIGCSFFFLFSCLENADKTLVLPDAVSATPIKQIIPSDLLAKIENYIPIYEGSTPPVIEGVYLVSPQNLVYTSNVNNTGNYFIDGVIKFENQNKATNIVTYESKEGSASEESSELVSVSGENDNFTAYFIATGTSQGISVKTSTIISGTITTAGVQHYKMAFIMLEKGADPDKKLMDVNDYRIFNDGDDLASNTTWDAASKVKSIETSVSQNHSKYSIYQSNKSTAK